MKISFLIKSAIMTGSIVAISVFTAGYLNTPTFSSVKARSKSSYATMYDKNGVALQRERIDYKRRRMQWVSFKDVPIELIDSLVRIEDKRFFSHFGIDVLSVANSIYNTTFHQKPLRGTSTLAMQLSSLLNPSLRATRKRRTLFQKIHQAAQGAQLQMRWSKHEILEAYLNMVSYHGEVEGLAAATEFFFEKTPAALSSDEIALLVTLVGLPNANWTEVANRACVLFAAISCLELTKSAESLTKTKGISSIDLAPQLGKKLLRTRSADIQTSLDARLQRFASDRLVAHLSAIAKQNVHEGAVLVMENTTGKVIAYVGNNPAERRAFEVDHVTALRQAGSTLKPFLYGLAFEQGYLTPDSKLLDQSIKIQTGRGIYQPENYNQTFYGWLSARTALASSINVPAVKVLKIVGLDAFAATLQKFGFRNILDGDDYGYSLALGTADVSLWDLTNAYRTLANNGVWSEASIDFNPPNLLPNRVVFKKTTTDDIADILSDKAARALSFGLENSLATPYWSAAKTGTSKNMRDNWCIGFNETHTVGVWVGNTTGEAMWDVTGVDGAAPVWHDVLTEIERLNPSVHLAPRVRKTVTFDSKQSLSPRHFAFIISPGPDTQYALDPNIPDDFERIKFEADGALQDLFWSLNGKVLNSARETVFWKPDKGSHQLKLVDKNGKEEAKINFRVLE